MVRGFVFGLLCAACATCPSLVRAAEAQSPVEVLARGPVHEAFAAPATAPVSTSIVPKAPPEALQELPPGEKPVGEHLWIAGYWAWDDDRNDFLWVSGVWRTAPPGKRWVAGYWYPEGKGWRWVPGFWVGDENRNASTRDVTYLPPPPAPPKIAEPGPAPTPDSFFVPGHWDWKGDCYAWRAGYWAKVQPGYVWVAGHYRWSPSGHVFIPGYWDLAFANRGVLHAPVAIDPAVAGPTFVYTPTHVVREALALDLLFVRPGWCHYYFGDYYGPVYRELGYESCLGSDPARYDALLVYERWAHRREEGWESSRVRLANDRQAGRASPPPRTFAQQTGANPLVISTSQWSALKEGKIAVLAPAARILAQRQAQAVQQSAQERRRAEVKAASPQGGQPHTASLSVPRSQPIVTRALPAPAKTTTASKPPADDFRPVAHREPVKSSSPPAVNNPVTVARPMITGQSPTTQPAPRPAFIVEAPRPLTGPVIRPPQEAERVLLEKASGPIPIATTRPQPAGPELRIVQPERGIRVPAQGEQVTVR